MTAWSKKLIPYVGEGSARTTAGGGTSIEAAPPWASVTWRATSVSAHVSSTPWSSVLRVVMAGVPVADLVITSEPPLRTTAWPRPNRVDSLVSERPERYDGYHVSLRTDLSSSLAPLRISTVPRSSIAKMLAEQQPPSTYGVAPAGMHT